MRIAYFTAGTVGAGHLVRSLAIRRALGRLGFDGVYRSFGPATPFPALADSRHVVSDHVAVAMDEAQLRDPRAAPSSPLGLALRSFSPDVLLCDLFWAPLRHILPLADCECWLLLRRCPPIWLVGPPDLPFAPEHFARVLTIEPMADLNVELRHPSVSAIDPVVICNREEMKPEGALKDHFRIERTHRLIAVAHAGQPGEHERLCRQVAAGHPAEGQGSVARFNLFEERTLFPLAPWLSGADEIHSGAGYNAYWEAAHLGYLPRTRFYPFPRGIDDQALRVATGAGHRMRENGADTLARDLLGGGIPAPAR